MSDISIDLSGVIALLIFMMSAAGFGFAALIGLIIAIAGRCEDGIVRTKAFGFFVTAIAIGLVNLVGFTIMFYTVDSNSHDTNSILDISAGVWALLQLFVWIAAALGFNRVRLSNRS